MLIHRGEILQKYIESLNPKVSIAALARKVGYDRSTIYQHFKNSQLDYATILKYGKALKHDFSVEFPEMMQFMSTVEEPIADYTAMTVAEALRERDYWKDKYISLMEKHHELVMTHLVKDT